MTESQPSSEYDDLSRRVKSEAARQRISIELSEDQLNALRAAWDEGDPTAPAQLTFLVKGREIAEMAVAGYRYRGDTCCV